MDFKIKGERLPYQWELMKNNFHKNKKNIYKS